jgi:cytochrome P450
MISFKVSDIFYLSVVFIVIYVTQYYYRYFTRPNPLPGPFPLPFLGNTHQLIGWDYGDWVMSLQKKYGSMFEINFPGDRVIVLSRPDLIENMNTSSTKTKYPFKFILTEGIMEYLDIGENGSGMALNNNYKSWRYNRQFFSQAMLAPNFDHQAIEWTNDLWKEMESYWNDLGENRELDLITWIRRFTCETIFRITTGVKNNAVASHYYIFTSDNNDSLNEKEKEKIKESEDFIQSFGLFVKGFLYFALYNKYIRNYVPFIRGKTIELLKNRDHFYNKLYNIIKERRNEIDNTPLDQPLRHDMLTSYITANTLRDINITKRADADLLRPMTDKEILDNIIEAITAGIDTVSKKNLYTASFKIHFALKLFF